ncbi:MAG: TspO/MBR family protein [Patescibacteria group bacterium]
MKNWLKLTISIFLCQLAGIVGSFFTVSAIKDWYAFLLKPAFSPPNWIFGPVWVTLYTLMGISLFLIWKKGLNKKQVKNAFKLFLIHLVFNTAWSIIFFGMRNILGGFVEIIFMLVLIIIIIKKFYKIEKIAAYLLIPYLVWVTFATFLNFNILILNL